MKLSHPSLSLHAIIVRWHRVQNHPKIDRLPLTASFWSLGGCCTQLSTFPQRQVNQWIESQLPSHLPPNWQPPSTPPILLDHSLLQVHLQTSSITALECVSDFTPSRSPIASPKPLDHGLKVHLWVHSTPASNCISKLPRSRPHSTFLGSLDLGLQVHLQTHSMTATKCISDLDRSRSPSISLRSDGGCTEILG